MGAAVSADRPEPLDLSRVADFDLGALTVRPATREVVHAGVSETLEPRVMQVLVALAQDRGQVISRDRLIARCWGGRIVSEDAINTCMTKVRRLGEACGAYTIQTVPRVGYRLTPTSVDDRAVGGRSWLGRRWPIVVIVMAAVLAVATLLAGLALIRAEPSVAVAPFETATPAAAEIGGRVREEIESVLATRRVKVVSDSGLRSAPLLVGGTVEVSGDLARVSLSLQDRRTGLFLWKDQFEGQAGFNSPLSDRITAKATAVVTSAANMVASSRSRVSADALKSYILGMESQRDGKNFVEAVAYFRASTAQAPNAALAHASLSQSLSTAANDQPPATRQAWLADAINEANLAIKLDPKQGLGYAALSNAIPPKDFVSRQRVLSQGLKQAPFDGSLNGFAGLLFAEVGRPREGLPFIRRSQSMDPFAAPRQFGNADYFAYIGLVEEGRSQLQHARRIWPANQRNATFTTMFALEAAQPKEAFDLLAQIKTDYPQGAGDADFWVPVIQAIACRCGVKSVSDGIMRALAVRQITPGQAVVAQARLGQLDHAYEAAALIKPRGALYEMELLFADATAPMRRQARFIDLAGQLGLVDYWRTTGQWPEFCGEPLPYDCKTEAARVAGVKR